MSRKKPLPLLQDIEITGVAAEGNSIAKVDGRVVFIPYGAPGDIADVQLTRRKIHLPRTHNGNQASVGSAYRT